jgi:calmodulin
MDELKEMFSLFDKNGKGMILAKELSSIMAALGQPVNDTDLKELLMRNNLEFDGYIDYSTFQELLRNLLSNDDRE